MADYKLSNGQIIEAPDHIPLEQINKLVKAQFGEDINVSPVSMEASEENLPESKGFRGIVSDVGESVQGLLPALYQSLAGLPKQFAQAGRQAISSPVRAGENFVMGLGEGVEKLINYPSDRARYLQKKEIPYFKEYGGYVPRIPSDLGIERKVLGEPQEGDEAIRGISSMLPAALVGGGTGLLGKGLAYSTTGGEGGDAVQSALLGLAGEGISKAPTAIKSVARKAKPSVMLRGELSPEELKYNLDTTEGTKTSLGNIIENPTLKKQFENIVSKIPFSDANKEMLKTAKQVKAKGDDLISDLRGNVDHEDVGQTLKDFLKKATKDINQQKNDLYTKVDNIAEKKGIKIGRDNLSSTAADLLAEISKSDELERQLSPSIKKELQALAEGYEEKSLKLSNIFKGNLGNITNKYFKSGDKNEGNIYSKLHKALMEDIKKGINKSGDSDLQNAYTEAEKFYKKKVVPFEHPNVVKYTRKDADPDLLINDFIRTSKKSDRKTLLNVLTDKLPEDKKNLPAYGYFQQAIKDNKLNPEKLKTLHEGLGYNQRKLLLGDKAEKFKKYSNLVKMNSEPLSLMFNPNNGARGLEALTSSLKSLLSPTLAASIGGLAGGMSSAAGAAMVPSVLGKVATKLLTDPKIRENLVNKMINAKTPKQKSMAVKSLEKALAANIQASNRNNKNG